MHINKTQIVKTATSFVVGAGTSKIVNDIIENNVDTEKPVDQVTVKASSLVIGSMIADKCRETTDRAIDSVVETYEKIRDARKSDQN